MRLFARSHAEPAAASPARVGLLDSIATHHSFYSTRFDTVEVDLTFYAIPTIETVENWARKTPLGFVFPLKAPQGELSLSWKSLRRRVPPTILFASRRMRFLVPGNTAYSPTSLRRGLLAYSPSSASAHWFWRCLAGLLSGFSQGSDLS